MEIIEIESVLKQLTESNPQILLSMIISADGLQLAYDGEVDDPENVGALYSELELISEKIMVELKSGRLKEMFIRSESACVTILPISETEDKGILACMTTTDINSRMMMHITWKAVNQLDKVM